MEPADCASEQEDVSDVTCVALAGCGLGCDWSVSGNAELSLAECPVSAQVTITRLLLAGVADPRSSLAVVDTRKGERCHIWEKLSIIFTLVHVTRALSLSIFYY